MYANNATQAEHLTGEVIFKLTDFKMNLRKMSISLNKSMSAY